MKVKNGQSLFDVAVITTGDNINAIDIALANDLSLTQELNAGSVMEIYPVESRDVSVISFLNTFSIVPATGLQNVQEEEQLEGIGYWAIGIDFIIS